MSETKFNSPYHDLFLDGNELIEEAIDKYYEERSKDSLLAVLDTIRQRMHADGHFIFPVIRDEQNENNFSFRSVQTNDGKHWTAAFTSQTEFWKGEPSEVISNFIDTSMRFCLESNMDGFVINPWGRSFLLAKELIEMIFEADGDLEYSVPDDPITPELLADGSFLKRAADIYSRNRTQLNMIKLTRILRDSYVWIPCNAVLSDADYNALENLVKGAENSNGLDSLVGKELTNQDSIRLIPDILQNGDSFFFPVFTTAEEMGEYGDHFSKVEKHFLEAVNLAKNNPKDVAGIVINAFSAPVVISKELFDVIAGMESGFDRGDESFHYFSNRNYSNENK